MSERYGTPGELKELCESLEDWVNGELDKARAELKQYGGPHADRSYNAGRVEALRDVLEILIVNPGG